MDTQNHAFNPPDPAPEALLEELAWLRQVARALLGRGEDAEDLVQEVMTEAVRQSSRTQDLERPRLRSWLRTVAKRKAWRSLTRTGSRREAETSASLPEADKQPSPAETLERLELHRELTREIEQLEPADRQLIVQRYLQGQPPAAIAAQLGVSSPVIRKRLARALDRLRGRLRSTPRGDSWLGALALLAGEAPRATPPLLAAGTGLLGPLSWMMAKLPLVAGLIAASISALWLTRSSDRQVPTPVPAVQGFEVPSSDTATQAAAQLRHSDPQGTDRSRAQVPVNEPIATAAERTTLRAVRADGTPVPGALGAYVPKEGQAALFTFDGDGFAALPEDFQGSVYAGTPGLGNARIDLDKDPHPLDLVLRDTPALSGTITVAGEAPDETLRLKRFVGNREAGIRSGLTSARALLEEGGLVPDRLRLTTTESGAFQVALPWLLADIKALEFSCPPAFLVSSVNGDPVTDRTQITLPIGAEPIHVDLERLPSIRGRLRWKDTGDPVRGTIVHQRLDAQGLSMDGIPFLDLDGEGGFEVPAVAIPRNGKTEPGPRAVTLLLHVQDPPAANGARFRIPLEEEDLPMDLGDLEVERADSLPVLVRGRRADGSYQPLTAGLIGPNSTTHTEANGRGTILFRPGQTLEVLSAGWHHREVAVPQGLYTEEVPFRIDLEPAPLLTLVGCQALRSSTENAEPMTRISFDWTPFETAELDADNLGVPYGNRIHNALAKATGGTTGFASWSHVQPGAPGYVTFRLPPADRFEIPGLTETRPFSVEVVDGLGQLLMSENVTLTDSRTIDLAPAAQGASTLTCRVQWPDGTPVESGRIQLAGSADRSIGLPFEEGSLRVSPLAPGDMTLEVQASGANTLGQKVSLMPGQDEVVTLVLARSQE